MNYIKFIPVNREISNRDENHFLYLTVNMLASAAKFGILTWGSMGIEKK